MNATKEMKKLDLENATNNLSGIEKGRDIYYIVRSVSASGMSRTISFYLAEKDETISSITWSMAQVLGYKVTNYHGFNAIRVNGIGEDMGFKLVYELGLKLYKNGYHFDARAI